MQIYREKSIHLIIKFSPNNITLKFATRSLTKYYQETNSLPVMRSEFRCKKLVALRHGWYTSENDVIIFFSDRSVHNQTKSNTASAQEIIQTYIKLTQSQETSQTLLLISISTRTKFSNQLCIWYNVKAIFTGNVKWAIVGFFFNLASISVPPFKSVSTAIKIYLNTPVCTFYGRNSRVRFLSPK